MLETMSSNPSSLIFNTKLKGVKGSYRFAEKLKDISF